jgi:hypothetical protein
MIRLLVMAALTLLAQGAWAGESDADKAVRITDALEKNPFAADAEEQRTWLIEWLVETPDYLVTVCDILGPVPSEEPKYAMELMAQMMFGNVRFQIRNPASHDELQFQLAGVASALAVYRLIVAEDPTARLDYFDGLLAVQAEGRLREHMEPIITDKCFASSAGG